MDLDSRSYIQQKSASNCTAISVSNNANSFRTYTPTANLTLSTQTVIEAQGTVYVTAALSEPATTVLTMPYTVSTVSGACTSSGVACAATSGTNYSGLASGSFSFAAGQSRSTISFTLLDDGTVGNPTINIALGSGTGYTVGTANPSQVITIQRPSLDLNFAGMFNPTAASLSSCRHHVHARFDCKLHGRHGSDQLRRQRRSKDRLQSRHPSAERSIGRGELRTNSLLSSSVTTVSPWSVGGTTGSIAASSSIALRMEHKVEVVLSSTNWNAYICPTARRYE